MSREEIRTEIVRLVRQKPFVPFFLTLENGDQLLITHPRAIAFDPITNGAPEFCAMLPERSAFAELDILRHVA